MFSYGIVSVVLQRGCDFYEGVRAGKSLQNMETKVEHGGSSSLIFLSLYPDSLCVSSAGRQGSESEVEPVHAGGGF